MTAQGLAVNLATLKDGQFYDFRGVTIWYKPAQANNGGYGVSGRLEEAWFVRKGLGGVTRCKSARRAAKVAVSLANRTERVL